MVIVAGPRYRAADLSIARLERLEIVDDASTVAGARMARLRARGVACVRGTRLAHVEAEEVAGRSSPRRRGCAQLSLDGSLRALRRGRRHGLIESHLKSLGSSLPTTPRVTAPRRGYRRPLPPMSLVHGDTT